MVVRNYSSAERTGSAGCGHWFKMKHKVAFYCLHFTSKCKDWYLYPIGLFADRWTTVSKMIVCISHGVRLFSCCFIYPPPLLFHRSTFLWYPSKKHRQMRKHLKRKSVQDNEGCRKMCRVRNGWGNNTGWQACFVSYLTSFNWKNIILK